MRNPIRSQLSVKLLKQNNYARIRRHAKYMDSIVLQTSSGEHQFPNKLPVTCCYVSSELMSERFKGKTFGFFHKDNPTELTESGGHDFCVVEDSIIIDWWLAYVHNETPETGQWIFDLNDPKDEDAIKRLYGDRNKWIEGGDPCPHNNE